MAVFLPNLPLASQLWVSDELDFTAAGVGWELFLPADSSRWFLHFEAERFAGLTLYYVTTKPVDGSLRGFEVNLGQPLDIEYQKYSTIISKPWYVNTNGLPGTIRYCESTIRRTKAEERLQDVLARPSDK